MPPPVSTPFFVIAGPTAGGKSALALQLAERCGGEIVGADAFQIYAGLEILTAQPEPAARARVPHHLVGEVPVGQRFDVAQYAEMACARIAEIHTRGRVPIVCGGTGLYVRALLRGLAELPAADEALRAELEQQPAEELVRRLAALDPAGATEIDLRNPRRVIRALEVCLLTGRPFSSFREQWVEAPLARGVFLRRDRAELHARIATRTEAMFTAGVEDEVRRVGEVGETARAAIGFREVQRLNEGGLDRQECARLITEGTRQYAKRQETWFRRETGLRPVEISGPDLEAVATDLAREVSAMR